MPRFLLRWVLYILPTLSILTGCGQAGSSPILSTPPSDRVGIFREKADRYLIKDSVLWEQIKISGEGIAIYSDSAAKAADSSECLLYWDELEQFQAMGRNLPPDSLLGIYQKGTQRLRPWEAPASSSDSASPALPLHGVRIALDPGHLGGTMEFAELEKRFVRMRKGAGPGFHEEISFNEGNLALGTALLLRDSLEALGATVFLSRSEEGQTIFGGTFVDWLATQADSAAVKHNFPRPVSLKLSPEGFSRHDLQAAALVYVQQNGLSSSDSTWWMENATARNVYKIPFLKADFAERARQINAFRPDLTLVLHFNIFEKNESDASGYLVPVKDNYCLAFIPGSFMAGELARAEDRMAFLRLLTGNELDRSEALSSEVVRSLEEVLAVPSLEWDDSLRYLRRASLRTPSRGVFARNLSMTRLVQGAICYGEALYQDNEEEALRLNQKDFVLPGMQSALPQRVREVAHAYLRGILAYLDAS